MLPQPRRRRQPRQLSARPGVARATAGRSSLVYSGGGHGL